ncbi:hypothetical protein HQN87_12765 [Paenibacillus tritici]|uniref:Aminodeoxychorismate lyase n=1 Tax=Paenibacillus tritici TaxID=1873425 RepID=A0ABX2DQ27_9BACL|nr:hypothetical protein [Paenibacillus tritici]NQX46204.1 hypothetical protein [Paenibacillus tritici]
MIRNRFFMLGLGVGLIAGALLLQIMIAGRATPLTKEELIQEAARLNLAVVDQAGASAEGTPSPQEGGQAGAPQETAGAEAKPTAAASPAATPPATPKAAVTPSAAVTPGQPSAPAQPKSTAETAAKPPATPDSPALTDGNISLRIPTGITLAQTADLLAEAGVIQDKVKFLQVADSRKVNTIIQYGSYSFTKGESINSIIDKLITVKK